MAGLAALLGARDSDDLVDGGVTLPVNERAGVMMLPLLLAPLPLLPYTEQPSTCP